MARHISKRSPTSPSSRWLTKEGEKRREISIFALARKLLVRSCTLSGRTTNREYPAAKCVYFEAGARRPPPIVPLLVPSVEQGVLSCLSSSWDPISRMSAFKMPRACRVEQAEPQQAVFARSNPPHGSGNAKMADHYTYRV